jgi:rhodanese-related sulfurtransferase
MKHRTRMTAVWECVTIVALGSLAALAANAIHPDGVKLRRDYFPRNHLANARPRTQPLTTNPMADASDPDPEPAVDDEFSKPYLDKIAHRLQEQGFQVARHDEVVETFKDPLARQGYYIFIDARNDAAYTEGHIPGAYQLDHYRIEDYIDNVLPPSMTALKIIIYCSGGPCEDSEFAALELFDRGIDPSKVYVYPGGVGLWKRKGQPIETGLRDDTHPLPNNTDTSRTSTYGGSP